MSPRSSTLLQDATLSNAAASDVEKAQVGANTAAAQESQEASTELVDWDGPDDPENPQNW